MLWRNVLLITVIVLFSGLGMATANTDGQCKKLLTTICNDCHNTDRVCESMGGTEKKWKGLIDWMIANGAELEDDEKTLLINCLMEPPSEEAKQLCKK